MAKYFCSPRAKGAEREVAERRDALGLNAGRGPRAGAQRRPVRRVELADQQRIGIRGRIEVGSGEVERYGRAVERPPLVRERVVAVERPGGIDPGRREVRMLATRRGRGDGAARNTA